MIEADAKMKNNNGGVCGLVAEPRGRSGGKLCTRPADDHISHVRVFGTQSGAQRGRGDGVEGE